MKKILLAVLVLLVGCSSGPNLDAFAQCLTEEGVKMYGAFWCPHCQNQKDDFGSSFRYVDYVECDPRGEDSQSELCIEKGIEGYPTWELPDGTMIQGEVPLQRLEGETSCEMPR